MPHISFSELKNWVKCAHYHKLVNIDKLKGFVGSEHTAFGSAIHEVCERQVLGSLKNSKTIVISESIQKNILNKIKLDAKKIKIPMVEFKGTSIALGKLCGLQFRVSIVSLNSISDSTIKSILKEAEEK